MRVRGNFYSGTLTANLGIGGTTMTSPGFSSLPVITAPDFMPITLDVAGVGGSSEIVWITAHGSGANTATVLKGQEGTVDRAHLASNAPIWHHAPTAKDFALVKCRRFNIEEYGAVLDGSNDDTTPINNAIIDAAANGGGDVILNGTPKVTDTINGADDVYLIGSGHRNTELQYGGAGAIDIIQYNDCSNFGIHGIGVKITGNYANLNRLIRLTDCVYFEIDDVEFAVAPAATATGATGILIETVTGSLVPPRGVASIRNILFTSGGVQGLSGSRCIEIRGNTGKTVSDISLEGWGNCEEAEFGLYINNLAGTGSVIGNVTVGPAWFFQRCTTSYKLVGATNISFINPHSGSPYTQHFSIDANSFDTTIISPALNTPTSLGTNNGVRTLLLNSGGSGGDTNIPENLGVGGHVIADGVAPAVSAGAGAGSTASASGNGTDLAGQLTVIANGSGLAAGYFAQVTFDTPYASAPRSVMITPLDAGAVALAAYVPLADITTTGFYIKCTTVPTGGGTHYNFSYLVMQ